MWNTLKNILIGVFATLIVVASGASAYNAWAAADETSDVETTNPALSESINPAESRQYGPGSEQDMMLPAPSGPLNEDEIAALLYMREEEKLARDVYTALYAAWGQPVFQNIAASEQMHMDAIKILLDTYELADPALEAGLFSNPDLQALYNQLVAQGSQSLDEALKTGAAIEEIDILDLQERLAQTDHADLQQVFNNLLNGSYHHLQAFTSTLSAQTGAIYQPQYLTQEAYDEILSQPMGYGEMGQGYMGQSGMGQGNMGQDGIGQGNMGQGGIGQGNMGQGDMGQGYMGQGNMGQGYMGQGDMGQDGMNQSAAAQMTWEGTVAAFDGYTLTLSLPDGSTQPINLGNINYVSALGFAPAIGDTVSVSGRIGLNNQAMALSATWNGQVYTFRDTSGRPSWHGGKH